MRWRYRWWRFCIFCCFIATKREWNWCPGLTLMPFWEQRSYQTKRYVCLFNTLLYMWKYAPSAVKLLVGTRVTRLPPSFGLLALQEERAYCLALIIVCKWGLNYNLFFYGSQEEASETQWEYEDEDLTMEGWCFGTLLFSEILICSTYYCYYLCSVLFWTLLTVTVFYASNYEKQSTICVCLCKVAGLI